MVETDCEGSNRALQAQLPSVAIPQLHLPCSGCVQEGTDDSSLTPRILSTRYEYAALALLPRTASDSDSGLQPSDVAEILLTTHHPAIACLRKAANGVWLLACCKVAALKAAVAAAAARICDVLASEEGLASSLIADQRAAMLGLGSAMSLAPKVSRCAAYATNAVICTGYFVGTLQL